MTITKDSQDSHFNIPIDSEALTELARRATKEGKNINVLAGELLAKLLVEPAKKGARK